MMSRSRNAHNPARSASDSLANGGSKPLSPDLKNRFPHRLRYVPPIIVLCVGVALSIGLFVIVGKWEDEYVRGMFNNDVEEITYRLERSLASDREVLGSIAGFYSASASIDRKQFGTFVAGALSRHPHLQALEWIPFVPSSERHAYEEAARSDGYPDFQFTERDDQGNVIPASERSAYFPVYYVEPLVGNEAAFGFDLGSNPERLEALERARDSGMIAATARITLVQETGKQFGFLIFLPIYRNGASPNTVEERRAGLIGFSLSVFRVGDYIERSIENLDHGPYGVQLFDMSAPEGQRLLYASIPAAGDEADPEQVPGPNKIARFEVGWRQWSLIIYPKSGRLPGAEIPIAGAVLAVGLLMTTGLVTYLVLALRHTDELSRANTKLRTEILGHQQTAEALRESEERYRRLVELSPDAIAVHSEGMVIFANTAAARLLGAEETAQLIGKPLLQLVHPDYRTTVTQRVRLQEEGKEAPSLEEKLLRLDGTPVDVEVTAMPLVFDGKMAMLAVVRDITERKRAEELLEQSFEKLQQTLEDTIRAMARIVEMRDPYTAGHQERVAVLACAIAKQMGLSDDQIHVIRLAAVIHDIGKINVPAEILSKPGRLGEIEFSLIKSHSASGYDILKTIDFPWPIADIVLQHHERMDGSGYPAGLTDDSILPEARILGVADVVEAMASHRPYRPALGIQAALEEITPRSGVLYDAQVVRACCTLFGEKGFAWEQEQTRIVAAQSKRETRGDAHSIIHQESSFATDAIPSGTVPPRRVGHRRLRPVDHKAYRSSA